MNFYSASPSGDSGPAPLCVFLSITHLDTSWENKHLLDPGGRVLVTSHRPVPARPCHPSLLCLSHSPGSPDPLIPQPSPRSKHSVSPCRGHHWPLALSKCSTSCPSCTPFHRTPQPASPPSQWKTLLHPRMRPHATALPFQGQVFHSYASFLPPHFLHPLSWAHLLAPSSLFLHWIFHIPRNVVFLLRFPLLRFPVNPPNFCAGIFSS